VNVDNAVMSGGRSELAWPHRFESRDGRCADFASRAKENRNDLPIESAVGTAQSSRPMEQEPLRE
jgi:hypothetical protein